MKKFVIRSSDELYVKELTGREVEELKLIAPYRPVKIGQTKSYLGSARHLQLNKVNKCTLVDLCEQFSLAHPTNVHYKLTDHRVREYILDTNPEVMSLPESLAKNALGMNDGFSEILLFPISWSTDEIVNVVEVALENRFKFDITTFAKNNETARDVEKVKQEKQFVVPSFLLDGCETFEQILTEVTTGSRILLLRQFPDWFVRKLIDKGAIITNVIDNRNAYVDVPALVTNIHVILTDFYEETHEFIEVIEAVDKNFDIMISNPPYRIGNECIVEAMKHCKRGVVLMPFSCFNGKKLYRKVEKCVTVSSNLFEDADISNNTLCVTTLDNEVDNGMTEWSEFKAAYKTAEQYREFYILNQRLPRTVTNTTTKMDVPIDVSTTFMISPRVGDDGVHKALDCYDYRFNVLENLPQEEWSVNTYKGKSSWNFTPYRLNSVKAKKNLCRFWYGNPLMNELIRNSGESSSSYNVAMPRVNWELDLDWEGLTYDELLDLVKQQLCELGISYDIN